MTNWNDRAIASLGSLNLLTGTSKYFNVYETWNNSTAEIHEKIGGQFVVIFTYGDEPSAAPGKLIGFKADQTGRHLFVSEMVASCLIADLPKLAATYGKKLRAYTYK